MKKTLLITISLLTIQFCSAQTNTSQANQFYSKEFKWTFITPDGFSSIGKDQFAVLQKHGADKIEATYNKKVENHTTLLFASKADQFNYIEANYQPFDPSQDGDYLTSCKAVDKLLYGTFKAQIPQAAKIDSAFSTEIVDNLTFQRFEIKVYIGDIVLHMLLYSRLFDKRELSFNMVYVDEEKGRQILKAWRDSKFAKD
jgi:hypothetical protein